jgi:hypothetical protein
MVGFLASADPLYTSVTTVWQSDPQAYSLHLEAYPMEPWGAIVYVEGPNTYFSFSIDVPKLSLPTNAVIQYTLVTATPFASINREHAQSLTVAIDPSAPFKPWTDFTGALDLSAVIYDGTGEWWCNPWSWLRCGGWDSSYRWWGDPAFGFPYPMPSYIDGWINIDWWGPEHPDTTASGGSNAITYYDESGTITASVTTTVSAFYILTPEPSCVALTGVGLLLLIPSLASHLRRRHCRS